MQLDTHLRSLSIHIESEFCIINEIVIAAQQYVKSKEGFYLRSSFRGYIQYSTTYGP